MAWSCHYLSPGHHESSSCDYAVIRILLMDAKIWMVSLMIMFAVRPICTQDAIFKMCEHWKPHTSYPAYAFDRFGLCEHAWKGGWCWVFYVDPDLCHHVASLGSNELMRRYHWSCWDISLNKCQCCRMTLMWHNCNVYWTLKRLTDNLKLHIYITNDSFTVSLHSPNGRQLSACC